MKYTFAKAEKSTVKIKIDLTEKEWNEAIDAAYEKTKGRFSMPGFRKGKVPRHLLESTYGKGVFYEEAINQAFPKYYSEVLEKEKAILVAQMKEDPKMANKPEAVLQKIVEGKIGKYYKENCLLCQEFVRSDLFEGNVKGYVDSVAKALGADIKVTAFVRFEKGEGIEKKTENFADEIASMVNGK